MSYSFSIRAATKADAKASVASKMAEVVQNQPTHAHDQPRVCACAAAFIDLLADDESKDIVVSVYGSLGWRGSYGTDPANCSFTSANISVTANLVDKS